MCVMKVDDFDFHLPKALIADRPARPRDSARLLHVGKQLADRRVADLPDLLRPGDLLVVNDTRVIPARLRGRRGDAKVEVTLHLNEAPDRWRAFARPAKRLKPGDRIEFGDGLAALVTDREGGEVSLTFSERGPELLRRLETAGEMPLPPYIPRPGGADAAAGASSPPDRPSRWRRAAATRGGYWPSSWPSACPPRRSMSK